MLCHNYIFFDAEPSLGTLPPAELQAAKNQFAEIVRKHEKVNTYAYGTLGLKAGSRMMLWMQADAAESAQDLVSELVHSELGRHLKIAYTLFGLVRPSQYTKNATAQEQAANSEQRGRYLIVYPFTKTKEWYLLSFEERKELMFDHMRTGHKFKEISQVLLYAFGLDDHEFIVSYETENLLDFQTLVMELRATKARLYTENDTPIFTCIYKPLSAALELL